MSKIGILTIIAWILLILGFVFLALHLPIPALPCFLISMFISIRNLIKGDSQL